jgi:Putative prokaryotic signal transducing protein
MFCPQCRCEFREGFTVCSDCHIPLVPELEPEPEPEFVEYEEVLTTFNPFDIAFIKSLLDGQDILYYFNNEHFNYVRPLAEPVRLMVEKDQAETVRELLKDMTLSYGLSGWDKTEEEEE